MLIRLLEFRPDGQTEITDRYVREELEPALLANEELRFLYSARSRDDHGETRQVVSIWDAGSRDENELAADLQVALDCEKSVHVKGIHITVMPLKLALTFEKDADASIMRLFRGQTQPDDLEAYVEDARTGTLADSAADHGPLSLFLGVEPVDHFMTISIWSDWDKVSQATGGNVRAPIATRHTHRLTSWEATHYEIIPYTTAGAVSGPPATSVAGSEALES